MTPVPADDPALLAAAQAAIRAFVRHRLPPGDVSDAAQETLVRALAALAAGVEPVNRTAWLRGIARNVVMEAHRRRRADTARAERALAWAGVEASPWEDGVADRMAVADAVELLDRDLRSPLVLHYLADLSVNDVATRLDLTTGAVKTRLWRARRELRTALLTTRETSQMTVRTIASEPPDMISVGLHTGGARWATAPLSPAVLPDRAPSIDALRRAIDWTSGLAEGLEPLTATVLLWAAPEPFAHPDPVAVLRALGDERFGDALDFTPTDGWALATRPDGISVLEAARELGLHHLVVTLAGDRDLHDALTGRPGAYDAVIETARRAAKADVRVHVNLEINAHNIGQLGSLADVCNELGAGHAAYLGGTLGDCAYERIRPTVAQLEAVPRDDPRLHLHPAEAWTDLRSDGELTRAVLDGEDVGHGRHGRDWLSLYVGHDLTVHAGHAVMSSLGVDLSDPLAARRAVATLAWPADPPPPAELARRYGDPTSELAHGTTRALHREWVAAWARDEGVAWHPFL